MSVADSLSEPRSLDAARRLDGVRALGGVTISFKAGGDGLTRLSDLYEHGGFRAKLPRPEQVTEAVLVNTGGGLLGGDRVQLDVQVAADARARVTTQSAERIYRSLGPDCCIEVTLAVAHRARLDWLPQETILFNGARLARTISADVVGSGTLLLVEATVFGRAAMRESVLSGALRDHWRIRRDGRLVYEDRFRIAGDITVQMQHAAVGAGATAMATIVYVAPDASDRLEPARAALAGTCARAALSTWNGMLIGRLLAHSAEALKDGVARLAAHLAGHALPRLWGQS